MPIEPIPSVDPIPENFNDTTSQPRREVLPSISLASFDNDVISPATYDIFQAVDQAVTAASPTWLLAHRNVFDVSIMTSVTSATGLLTLTVWNGGGLGAFRYYDQFLLMGLGSLTTVKGYVVPGWSCRWTLSCPVGTLRVDEGIIKVRGDA